jgi:hypothetical protein
MNKRIALSIAAAVAMTLAAATTAVAVNLRSTGSPTNGPGTFTPSTIEAVATAEVQPQIIYVDETVPVDPTAVDPTVPVDPTAVDQTLPVAESPLVPVPSKSHSDDKNGSDDGGHGEYSGGSDDD